jgi:thiosulfate/3-mercaptopyruvate sulfurtransferase
MNNKVSPIISAKELKLVLDDKDLVLIDASYPNGKESFKVEHIKGALYVDLDADLADIKSDYANGGRHPLPSVEQFTNLLGHLGIQNNSHVVIYDRNNGAFASRMWWMMRSIGHQNVQVLNGGFAQALANGVEMETESLAEIEPANYSANSWSWKTSNMDEVTTALNEEGKMVIDVRGQARYDGEVEPIDIIAGHIPDAMNVPFADNLRSNGTFKNKEALINQYREVLRHVDSKNVIFHCGSGVTACHSILALDIAGFETPSLYVGSWSEWSRNNKPMVTNEK